MFKKTQLFFAGFFISLSAHAHDGYIATACSELVNDPLTDSVVSTLVCIGKTTSEKAALLVRDERGVDIIFKVLSRTNEIRTAEGVQYTLNTQVIGSVNSLNRVIQSFSDRCGRSACPKKDFSFEVFEAQSDDQEAVVIPTALMGTTFLSLKRFVARSFTEEAVPSSYDE